VAATVAAVLVAESSAAQEEISSPKNLPAE
jgi:hypothetical protein